jgi:hypothetical protein
VPFFVLANPPSLAESVRHLTALAALDLPVSMTRFDPLPERALGEAEHLTRRFPEAPTAWIARGRCEMRAVKFEAAERSFQRAESLGHIKGSLLKRRALRYGAVAGRLAKRWGTVVQLSDEGSGYWLATCNPDDLGDQPFLEVQPDGTVRELATISCSGAGNIAVRCGWRNLDRDPAPELIVQSLGSTSGGGASTLCVLKGKRGAWRLAATREDVLWDIPLVDLDKDGIFELVIRDWVWYHGPTWSRLYRLDGGNLREITRRYPAFLRRQVEHVRASVQGFPDAENAKDARRFLSQYGYRL